MDIQIARFSFPPKNSSLCLVDPGDRRHTGSGLAWRQTGRSYQWLFFFLLFFFPPCLLWFLFRVLWGWLVGWSYPGKEKTHLGWYILFIGFSMASSQFTGAGFFPWIIIKKRAGCVANFIKLWVYQGDSRLFVDPLHVIRFCLFQSRIMKESVVVQCNSLSRLMA